MKRLVFLCALIGLLTGCAFGRGYYGPFEVVVKTENGEHVDDIIVTLAMIGPSGMEGLGSTYDHTVVASTDQVITFPRGYVSTVKQEKLTLEYSVRHPDYLVARPRTKLTFATSNDGTVRFPDIKLEKLRDYYRREQEWQTQNMRAQGLSDDQIAEKIKNSAIQYRERFSLEGAEGYFSKAVNIRRLDLIDHYLPLLVGRVVAEEQLSQEKARELEQRYRDRVQRLKDIVR